MNAAIYTGHREHEHTMEHPLYLTIEKGQGMVTLNLPETPELENKWLLGLYIIRQWDGTKPLKSRKNKNALLSVDALANAWLKLVDDKGCPIIKDKPLITLSLDIKTCCAGKYVQIVAPNSFKFQSSELWIDTECLVEDKEDLVIHFVFMDQKKCPQHIPSQIGKTV